MANQDNSNSYANTQPEADISQLVTIQNKVDSNGAGSRSHPESGTASNGVVVSAPSSSPPPPQVFRQREPGSFWQGLRQGWDDLSFRTKLVILLVGGAAIPVFIVTQGIVAIAQKELESSFENTLKKELTILDEEVKNVRDNNKLVAGTMARQVASAEINLSNPGAVANRSNFVRAIAQAHAGDLIGQNFHILTDVRGRTVAQTIEILAGDLSGYPALPAEAEGKFTQPKYQPVSRPTGIDMGDIPIVKNALSRGRSLAGVEVVKAAALQRLGLEKQASIGIREQKIEGLPDAKKPYREGKYDIDGGKAGLVVMAVEPVRVNGRLVGTAIVGTMLNRNYLLPDYVKTRTGVPTATLFAKDWRVSTNVPYTDGKTRAIGTRASREVAGKVLNRGEIFLGEANVAGRDYLSAYGPLYDHEKQLNPKALPSGMTYVGEPKTAVQKTLQNLALTGYGLGGGILLLAGLIAVPIAGSFSRPLRRLTDFARRVASGDPGVRMETTHRADEIGVLSEELNEMAASIQANLELARQQEERSRLFADFTARIRESLNLEDVLKTTVQEIRQVFKTDRVVILRFDPNWNSKVIAESVGTGWTEALGSEIQDHCLTKGQGGSYKTGRVRAIDDVYNAGLADCHVNILEQFEVKANLVAAIMVRGELFGLLIAHQCESPRVWRQSEVDLFTQLANQTSIALDQAYLLEQVEKARKGAEHLAEEQRQQKEAIQYQLIELLSSVEGATRGDLTVRADITAGEIGTVGDFFNAIVESLRQIVTQVKQAANQVNQSIGRNEGAMRHLAEEAIEQADKITHTLNSVEIMTLSIQEVAESASAAAEVARTASSTAAAGGAAMDLTVENILGLRETIAETAKKVKRLGEASQQISKVVALINQIALQTNLLAINASIEAVRAGEEGRGFAVVAEEVGALAAQSAAATEEIEKIVENIQQETSEVAQAMELGTSQVVEGTQLVTDAKNSLEQILAVSREIDELVESISIATVSQTEMFEGIRELMTDVALISERTSESSREVSSSLQETVEVAQQLQDSVGTFKVEADES